MPVTIRKVNGYKVSTPGGTKAKNTSATKAVKQKRLLQAVEYGWKPSGAKGRGVSEKALRKVAMKRRAAKK